MKNVWIYDGDDGEMLVFSNPRKAYDKLKSTNRLWKRDSDYPDYYNADGLGSYSSFLSRIRTHPEQAVMYLDNYETPFRVYKREII